jgi:hypothetical protein
MAEIGKSLISQEKITIPHQNYPAGAEEEMPWKTLNRSLRTAAGSPALSGIASAA